VVSVNRSALPEPYDVCYSKMGHTVLILTA